MFSSKMNSHVQNVQHVIPHELEMCSVASGKCSRFPSELQCFLELHSKNTSNNYNTISSLAWQGWTTNWTINLSSQISCCTKMWYGLWLLSPVPLGKSVVQEWVRPRWTSADNVYHQPTKGQGPPQSADNQAKRSAGTSSIFMSNFGLTRSTVTIMPISSKSSYYNMATPLKSRK